MPQAIPAWSLTDTVNQYFTSFKFLGNTRHLIWISALQDSFSLCQVGSGALADAIGPSGFCMWNWYWSLPLIMGSSPENISLADFCHTIDILKSAGLYEIIASREPKYVRNLSLLLRIKQYRLIWLSAHVWHLMPWVNDWHARLRIMVIGCSIC